MNILKLINSNFKKGESVVLHKKIILTLVVLSCTVEKISAASFVNAYTSNMWGLHKNPEKMTDFLNQHWSKIQNIPPADINQKTIQNIIDILKYAQDLDREKGQQPKSSLQEKIQEKIDELNEIIDEIYEIWLLRTEKNTSSSLNPNNQPQPAPSEPVNLELLNLEGLVQHYDKNKLKDQAVIHQLRFIQNSFIPYIIETTQEELSHFNEETIKHAQEIAESPDKFKYSDINDPQIRNEISSLTTTEKRATRTRASRKLEGALNFEDHNREIQKLISSFTNDQDKRATREDDNKSLAEKPKSQLKEEPKKIVDDLQGHSIPAYSTIQPSTTAKQLPKEHQRPFIPVENKTLTIGQTVKLSKIVEVVKELNLSHNKRRALSFKKY